MSFSIFGYLSTVQAAITDTDTDRLVQIVDLLHLAYLKNRTVFTMGNGASAALAAHMACDLGKGTAPDLGNGPEAAARRRLRIISLTDNPALITAYGNDVSYDDIFMEQLKNLLETDDVVIGISGSGGSTNVLRAMEYARRHGATTVGFTGEQTSAEKLSSFCDICLQAPATMIEQIEDLHVIYHHIIGINLRHKIADLTVATKDRTRMNGRVRQPHATAAAVSHDALS